VGLPAWFVIDAKSTPNTLLPTLLPTAYMTTDKQALDQAERSDGGPILPRRPVVSGDVRRRSLSRWCCGPAVSALG
jgi:hypothetical protein